MAVPVPIRPGAGRSEIREELETLETRMNEKFGQVKDELDVINGKLDALTEDVAGLKSDMEELAKAVVRIMRHLEIT